MIGVLPEEFWPYIAERFDEEPSPFAYRVAQPVAGLRYFRLDEPNCNGVKTWERITSFIAAGFRIAFGFVVPTSMTTRPRFRVAASWNRFVVVKRS